MAVVGFYSSAETQSAYSTAPADWVSLLSLLRYKKMHFTKYR